MSDSIVINTTKKRRVWEVDFIRGFCMLFVIWDHLMYDFGMIFLFDFSTPVGQAIGGFAREYWYSGIRAATHDYFVGAFVVVSGLSTVFSKNNWIKALKVFAAAMVVTLATHVATETGMVSGVVINYGVLHMLATCGIVYCVLKALRVPDWMIFVLGVAALTLGFYFESVNLREPIGLIFLFENMSARGWSPGDFFPLMPWLGWFLLGAVLGNLLYKDKSTRLGFVNEKFVSPVTFVGRHSLLFYLLSQGIGVALLFILVTLGWL